MILFEFGYIIVVDPVVEHFPLLLSAGHACLRL
jgi:hypothetical protein